MMEVQATDVPAHFQDNDRNSESAAGPEAPHHVDQFRIRASRFADTDGLERHAADRATAGRRLPDLRMHRAGVDGIRGWRLRHAVRGEKFFRLLDEFGAASSRAKTVKPPAMHMMVRRGRGIELHSADRIDLVRRLHRLLHDRGRLEIDTPRGYIGRVRTLAKTSVLKRLRRIEGQVRGLARMVEADRYCIDVVTQLSAVRAALRRAEEEILADHAAHCVENAIASGNKTEQRRKVAELIDVISRSNR
jgi:DNA-binding FrmR family transcriptional regulator